MSPSVETEEALHPEYSLWTPPPGRCVEVGPDHRPVPLPQVPLPLHAADLASGDPSDHLIGQGTYDYLRRFPDCPHNRVYAELLRDAYPHYLADLGAQAAMLAYKEVDAPYVLRQIASLKILALLEPENPGLLRQIGIAYYELATTFSEFSRCRSHLLSGLGFFQRALKQAPEDLSSLNYCGQIDFLLGDYPVAARRWGVVVDQLEDGPARRALATRLERIENGQVPDHPLVNDLEAVGAALEACGAGDFAEARQLLEALEEGGDLMAEMPMAEFFYLLGLSRARCGDTAGAFAAFEQALEIDPAFQPVLEAREALLEGRAP